MMGILYSLVQRQEEPHSGGTRYDTGVVYTGDGSTVSASDYISNFNTYTTRSVTINPTASTPNLFYYCAVHPLQVDLPQ